MTEPKLEAPRMDSVLVLRTPSVLIVEDDPDIADVFRSVLGELDGDIEIHVFESVPEAEAWLHKHRVDLVVADYMLGDDGSGFAMRGWMERNRPDVAFAMTSSVSPKVYAEMSGSAPSPFLAKPFTAAECRAFFVEMLPRA